MGKALILTGDREAGACYLGIRSSPVDDTIEWDTESISCDINLDIDAENQLVGIEFIGLESEGPRTFSWPHRQRIRGGPGRCSRL